MIRHISGDRNETIHRQCCIGKSDVVHLHKNVGVRKEITLLPRLLKLESGISSFTFLLIDI